MKKKLSTILLIVLITILTIAVGYGAYWLATPYKATEEALSTLTSTSTYDVSENKWIEFIPKDKKDTGFIFYPGGRVEPKAYSSLCKGVAEKGFYCVIVPMPGNLAIFNINAAEEIEDKYPEIKNWIIGGHSLGGSMAARYIENSDVDALILMGAYSDISLVNKNIRVKSIIGSNDKILNKTSYDKYKSNLPASTEYVVIEGGNHSQFGNYGFQDGDGEAKLTSQKQQELVINEIVEVLESF